MVNIRRDARRESARSRACRIFARRQLSARMSGRMRDKCAYGRHVENDRVVMRGLSSTSIRRAVYPFQARARATLTRRVNLMAYLISYYALFTAPRTLPPPPPFSYDESSSPLLLLRESQSFVYYFTICVVSNLSVVNGHAKRFADNSDLWYRWAWRKFPAETQHLQRWIYENR